MLSLADKIEADARSRLVLPPNRQPNQEIARYKAFLKLEDHRLQMLHRAGGSGREVCRGRATMMDVLLRHILEAIQKNLEASKTAIPKFALVAIGGYGRDELNPYSDIDIMFLHGPSDVTAGRARPHLGTLTDGLLYTLWDIGLKVGHSVRSIEDCVQAANSNMQSKTSLIEARLVAGDTSFFEQMQAMVIAKCVRGFEDAYITARIEDQAARRAKFGGTPLMQEPNIKNGCGGLRDYQNLLWMAFFKYRARTLGDLEAKELITKSERKQLDNAYDFLLWVRNELHYTGKRALDVLTKALQPSVAHNLGYTDRSPSKRLEAFMRDVYTHMRHIYIISRTIEERLALLPASNPGRLSTLRKFFRGKKKSTEQIIDGFKILNDQISETTRTFKEQPRRLMRVFLYAQRRGLRLHPDLAQNLRNQLSLVDRAFLQDEHVHETFLEILNQRGNVAPILRSMHEVGLLGKYLPEFGKLTCLVQHEFYHQYTADEHTLVCIEKLDNIWAGKFPEYNHYTLLFQQIDRPFILYLALLLHDTGKALHSGKHADAGGKIVLGVAKRLGLDGATTHTLRLLVENHLTMAQVSQRRDLDDPAVIRNFASQLQSREHVMMLALLTFADAQGTSEKLWNGFKDSLLWTLFSRSMDQFGGTEIYVAEHKQLELLKEEVQGILPPTFSPEEIEAHFKTLPRRYFQIHKAEEIAADIALAHRFMHLQIEEEERSLEPVITWHNEQDRGYTCVHICTWDRARLFSKIAGSLSASGLNILSAQIFTRSDGIILDTFYVIDAKGGGLAKKEEKEQFETVLKKSLLGEVDFPAQIAKAKVSGRIYHAVQGERIPTSIFFDNETSETLTIMDIETEDRVGLLYQISHTLADLGIDIALAKILTEKGAAIDTFYISTAEREKISDLDWQRHIEEKLREAISGLDEKRK
jgi:[protein-PII] uridylyltransferase